MRKKNYLLFFYLPVVGFVVIFFAFSSLNRNYIKNKVEFLVEEQLRASAEILKVNFSHLLSENYNAEKVFDLYSDEENIYYIALFNESREILGWKSQFEGYLPISMESMQSQSSWIIDSPAGKIFNSFSSFTLPNGETYYLYMGYSLIALQEMMAHSRRNFYLVFGLIILVGIVFSIGLYQIQTHYMDKKSELEEEKRQKERYREISALMSGVAHEIKNPLNSLSLLFELLMKKGHSSDPEAIVSGREEVVKISRIVDQFSSSLKPIELSKDFFSLEEEIESVLNALKKTAEERNVEIRCSVDSPVILFADRVLLNRAIHNIVKNAIEATDGGEVDISVKREKKKIFISIKDSGKGMDDKEKARVFEPFFSTKKGGMGIGLYLTRKIVEAHGGELDLVSRIQEGTTFTIRIPGG
ncbi:MAG: HAMP domain-containing sensor histidine kinase [Candidatus Aminicenantes bacterium]